MVIVNRPIIENLGILENLEWGVDSRPAASNLEWPCFGTLPPYFRGPEVAAEGLPTLFSGAKGARKNFSRFFAIFRDFSQFFAIFMIQLQGTDRVM